MTHDEKVIIARELASYLGVRNVNHVELAHIVSVLDAAAMRGQEEAAKTMLAFIKLSGKSKP